MLVQYRYSETDFVAYLLTLGLEYDKIETCWSTTSGKKTFAYFTFDMDKLIQYQNEFASGLATVNALLYAKNRKSVAKEMRESFNSFVSNN